MKFKTGRHAGKTLEEVLIKKPDFARWYIKNYGSTRQAAEFMRLSNIFAAKPFTVTCENCSNIAARASAYQASEVLMFWCDGCDMYSKGASRGKLTEVKTLRDVLDHIKLTASGNRDLSRRIAKSLAEAKGLPKRVGELQAVQFFEK